MKNNKLHMVLARLSHIKQLEIEFSEPPNTHSDILSILDNTQKYVAGNYEWAFGDLSYTNDKSVLFGRLGKISPEHKRTGYDENKKSFIEKENQDQSAQYSNFLFFEKYNVIAFQERPSAISVHQFCKMFSEVYKTGAHGDNVILNVISNKEETRKLMDSMSKLTSISLDVRKTNPSDKKSFRKFQNMYLIEPKADSFKGTFTSESGELSYKNTAIEEGMNLADYGYGYYTARGVFPGKSTSVTIKSNDKIQRHEISVKKEDSVLVDKIKSILYKSLIDVVMKFLDAEE